LLYEKVKDAEPQFVKLADIPLIEKSTMFEHLSQTKLKGDWRYETETQKLAFLSQKNILNHILVTKKDKRKSIEVSFAACRADLLEEKLCFLGSMFKICVHDAKGAAHDDENIKCHNFRQWLKMNKDTYRTEIA